MSYLEANRKISANKRSYKNFQIEIVEQKKNQIKRLVGWAQ